MGLNEDIRVGPGLPRVNSSVLDNTSKLLVVIAELNEMLTRIIPEWNPQKKSFFFIPILVTL